MIAASTSVGGRLIEIEVTGPVVLRAVVPAVLQQHETLRRGAGIIGRGVGHCANLSLKFLCFFSKSGLIFSDLEVHLSP